jgi:periplasmic copper chaperone A
MLNRLLPILLALLIAVPLAARGLAGEATISVEKAWARATPSAAATGVVYLSLADTGPAADRLIGVATPVAAHADMHVMVMEGNVMQMRPVDAVDVKPGERIQFKPSGLHIMLTDMKQPLTRGERFPVTLDFEKAGKVDVEVLVLPIGASGYP